MSLAILFHFLCAQHVSDINISIIRSLRLCWWITTSVVLFSVRCVLELLVMLVLGGVRFAGWSLQQHSRKLLVMDILMSETCWAHKKWNKIANDIKLVSHSSANTMMHGPINIRFPVKFKNTRTRVFFLSMHWANKWMFVITEGRWIYDDQILANIWDADFIQCLMRWVNRKKYLWINQEELEDLSQCNCENIY